MLYFRESSKEMKSSIMESDAKIANLPIDGGWINIILISNVSSTMKRNIQKGNYNLYNALSGNDDALSIFINNHKPDIFILNLLDNNASRVVSLLDFGWSLIYMDGRTAVLIPSSSNLVNNFLKIGLINLENYKGFLNNKIKGCRIPLIGANEVYLNLALNNIHTRNLNVAQYILQKIINDNQNVLGQT